MQQTSNDKIAFIKQVVSEHERYWDEKRPLLKKYNDAYECRYWDSHAYFDGDIRVEVAEGYGYINGYVTSLYSRAPSVVIGEDEATVVEVDAAREAANRFLYEQIKTIQDGSRGALIYNSGFFKLAPKVSDNPLERVSLRSVPCWEIIVDRDASNWDSQRYVGHIYYLNMVDAKALFGNKKFKGIEKEAYLSDREKYRGDKIDLPEAYLYIKVVELYDLMYDKLYFWSGQYRDGEALLDKLTIPVRTYDDRPMPPIVPLYFSNKVHSPLEGLSAMSRIYDHITEKNRLRSHMANAVRRDARQHIIKEDAFDEEALALLQSGKDGTFIPVDTDSLDGLIREVPVSSINSNYDRYLNYIEQDINRNSILAPFSRGEATNTTATEVAVHAQYSASEIGMMARSRDICIENIAKVYLRMLALQIEDGEKIVLKIDGKAKVVTDADLDAKFKISALDQGSQPLSDSMKRQNLTQLIPILTQFGVPNDVILEEIVSAWDLPERLLEEAKKAQEEAAQAAQAQPQKAVGPGSVPREMQGDPETNLPPLAQSLMGTKAQEV